VLYLLHGLGDNDAIFMRFTAIERYARARGLAVVMPQAHRSLYADEEYGGRFWTFLTEELPERVATFFRVSERREDTFVAGQSMGGYGALKWALRQPERFAAAASLSAPLDLGARAARGGHPQEPALFRRVFGDRPVTGGDDDEFALLARADIAALPRLYVACGAQDALVEDNVAFVERARARGIDLTVDLGDGDHAWEYWDDKLRDVVAWLGR
jgi:S-formylglutathione hydrolase FrmB